MILGKIEGKTTTTSFSFVVDGDAKKFQYIQVYHKEYEYVLCQIVEIERDVNRSVAKCNIIGYKDNEGRIKQIRNPFEPGTEVLKAEDDFIKSVIQLDTSDSAFIGNLEGRDIPVNLDLKKMLTKHTAILAKTGAGKSYAVGVLVEEIMDRNVPLLIIDPHGEYSDMKFQNEEEKDKLKQFNIEPKGYADNIIEYGDTELNKELRPIKLNSHLSADEIVHILPSKLSSTQQALLYSVLSNVTTFDDLIMQLQSTDNTAKFNLISTLNYLRGLDLFSASFTQYNELITPGKCSIINLKGIDPEVQQIIVYKLLKDLFENRKKEKIPPFFVVVEEAHNYCPERVFGESKASKVLRTIASEGRKFGLGLCIVSQRPARVDKSVLSQCSTQIILKMTNPGDIKAISNSLETITTETENEIVNLPIGTAMVAGIVDMPLFVNIRPRRSKHGGATVEVLSEEKDFMDEVKDFGDLLPIIKPKLTVCDIKLSEEKNVEIVTYLIPCVLFTCVKDGNEFNLLMDQIRGEVVKDILNSESVKVPPMMDFNVNEMNIIRTALEIGAFSEGELAKVCALDGAVTRHVFASLLKKDLFAFSKGRYSVSESFNMMFNPEKLASFEKVEFLEVKFDNKLDKKIGVEELKQNLSGFVGVKDFKECYVVYHKVDS